MQIPRHNRYPPLQLHSLDQQRLGQAAAALATATSRTSHALARPNSSTEPHQLPKNPHAYQQLHNCSTHTLREFPAHLFPSLAALTGQQQHQPFQPHTIAQPSLANQVPSCCQHHPMKQLAHAQPLAYTPNCKAHAAQPPLQAQPNSNITLVLTHSSSSKPSAPCCSYLLNSSPSPNKVQPPFYPLLSRHTSAQPLAHPSPTCQQLYVALSLTTPRPASALASHESPVTPHSFSPTQASTKQPHSHKPKSLLRIPNCSTIVYSSK